MSKIFESNFETGSSIDKVTGQVISTPSFVRLPKGFGVLMSQSKIIQYNNFLYPTNGSLNTFTFVIYAKLPRIMYECYYFVVTSLFDIRTPGTNLIAVTDNYAIGTGNYSISKYMGKDVMISCTMNYIKNIGILTINNDLIVSFNISTFRVPTFNLLNNKVLKSYYSSPYNTNIYKLQGYNHILSQKEINDNYIQFLNSKPISKSIVFQPNLNIFKPSEVRE
jgi:hypothetical protein